MFDTLNIINVYFDTMVSQIYHSALQLKETKSATMNIFRKIFFSKNGVCKSRIKLCFTINMFNIAENCMEK